MAIWRQVRILPVHVRRLRSDLAVVTGEMAMHEERHALGERSWRGQDVLQPPELEFGDVQPVAALNRGRGQLRRRGRFRLQKSVDGPVEAGRSRSFQLIGRGPEAGATQQVGDSGGVAAKGRVPIAAGGDRALACKRPVEAE